jgi:hypothetical protein
MAEVEIKSNIKLGLTEILEGIAKLEVEEIELFLKEVAGVLALKKRGKGNVEEEADLVKKIKATYPSELKEQYEKLYKKMENEGISTEEEKRLIEISDKLETYDAKRLQYLLSLAKLRGQDLTHVLKEFSSGNFYA